MDGAIVRLYSMIEMSEGSCLRACSEVQSETETVKQQWIKDLTIMRLLVMVPFQPLPLRGQSLNTSKLFKDTEPTTCFL